MKLEQLLKNYRSNVEKIWDLRADSIYTRWGDEKGDFGYINSALNQIRPKSLLDIGFGYGRLAPVYKQFCYTVGMDISQRMLSLFKDNNKYNKKIDILLGDSRQMPFKKNSFACLVSIRTLNHIHPLDLESVQKEIARVCSGRVILIESDVKVPEAEYEFEHNYNNFLKDGFNQTKLKLEDHVFLRVYTKK